MESTFNLKKFLTENRLTEASREQRAAVSDLKVQIDTYKDLVEKATAQQDKIQEELDKIGELKKQAEREYKDILNKMKLFDISTVTSKKWVATLEQVAKYSKISPSYKELYNDLLEKVNYTLRKASEEQRRTLMELKKKETKDIVRIQEGLGSFLRNLYTSFKSLFSSYKSFAKATADLPDIKEEGQEDWERASREVEHDTFPERGELREGFATEEGRKLDSIARLLGYDDLHEMLGDNPGLFEVSIEWIDQTFGEQLAEEGINPDELERLGLYHAAEEARGRYGEDDFLDEDLPERKSNIVDIVQDVWKEKTLFAALDTLERGLESSKIKSKEEILQNAKKIKTLPRLHQYLANSVLKYEKLGLKEGAIKNSSPEEIQMSIVGMIEAREEDTDFIAGLKEALQKIVDWIDAGLYKSI